MDGVLSGRRWVGASAINGRSRWHVVGRSQQMFLFGDQRQGAVNMDGVKHGKAVYICQCEVG